MGSTLLQLVQQVTSELGVPTPSYVVGNTNQDVIQIQALMNASGYELLRKADWQQLVKQNIFTTTYQTTQAWYTNNATIIYVPEATGTAIGANVDATVFYDYMALGTGIGNGSFITNAEFIGGYWQLTIPVPVTTTVTQASNTQINLCKVKYALPDGYDSTIPRTHWDKSKRWEMLGPEDAQQWEWLLSGYISTGPRIRWRIFQNRFQTWPPVTTNEVLGYEYRSKAWVLSNTGADKNSFTADTDTCIYPDRLMVLSTKLKYFEAKGFDTTAMYRDYLTEFETSVAQNTSAANLSFAPRPGTVLIGYDNIPDSGYGTP